MCDCIKDIETKVKQEINPKYSELKGVCFSNKSWLLEGKVKGAVLSQPITIDYAKTTKGGKEIWKTDTIQIVPTYCPFCGQKLETLGEEGEA